MILKFQQGGGTSIPPLVTYRPVMMQRAAAPQQTTAAPKENKSDLTDKDLLGLIDKLEGLPNDSQQIVRTLQNFIIDEHMSPSSSSNIAVKYLQILGDLKIANFNRKEFDAAYKVVSENGGIDEFAISDRGQLVCVNNEGDFKLLTIDQLKEHEDEYRPLTNSELLHYRAYSNDMINKNDVLTIVKNGISMESITKLIQDTINKLGTSEDSQEGYGKTKSGRIVQGLEDFAIAVQQASSDANFNGTIHDLYKFKYLTKTQKLQAEAAITYIYKTLPNNAKTLLKTKTQNGTDEEAVQLIETLVSSQLNPTRHFDLDLAGGPSAKKTSGNNGNDSDLSTSLPLNVQKAIGGYDQSAVIDRGDGVQLQFRGTYYSQIKTPGGEPIINTSLQDMLAKSGLQSIIKNTRNITFGDQKLTPEQLSKITYNNTGLMRANLPVNPDGTVRLSILEDFEKAEAEIRLLSNPSEEQIAAIYKKHNLNDLLNPDGTINRSKFAPFMITEGYATDTNGIHNSKFVYEVGDPTDLEVNLLDALGNDVDVDDGWYAFWDAFGWHDTVYKAAIYIPIDNNTVSGAYGANQKLDYDDAAIEEAKYQMFNKLVHLNATGANELNK